jgi:hypothetical protein
MVLLTNPQTADLQQRIQNSSFGSPDYLQGFTGTMPGYQQNLLANNFQPGLITRDFSSGATSMNPSGIPNYLSYTPGVPPQYTDIGFELPYENVVNAAIRQGSNASDARQLKRDQDMQDQYGSIDGKFYDLRTGEVIDNEFANFFGKMFGSVSNESSIQKMLDNRVDVNKLPDIVSDPKYQKLMVDNGMFRKEVGGDYNYGGATSKYGGSVPNTLQRMLGGGGGVAGTGLETKELGYNAGQVDPGFVTRQVNPKDTGPAKGSNASDKRQADRNVGKSGTSASTKNTGSGSQATKAGATTGRKDGGFGW